MIPKAIYTNKNISKLPTHNTISPYIQALLNKLLTPILIIYMYMPTHQEDIHLIIDIQNQIHTLQTQHLNHPIILVGDFNQDILLQGRTTNDTQIPPTTADREWTQFTESHGLKVIANQAAYTRQGGYNYTSTSHIDGFYSNDPNSSNLQSHTITTLNQNSDHYPV